MAEQTKQLTPAQQAIKTFTSKVNGSYTQEMIKRSLGENAGTFTTSLVELFTNDKQLQTCDPNKVVMEAVRGAALHLPVSKALGYAYITVFNNWDKDTRKAIPTPTFMIGYRGLIQLAIRSGQYRIINADVCYQGMLKGRNRLTGEIDLTGEPTSENIEGYFAHIETTNGYTKTLYMSLREMAQYALRFSPSFKRKTGVPTVEELCELAQSQHDNGLTQGKQGWEGNFEAMALKTVLRQLLSKYGILSIEMQDAIANENKVIENAQAVEIRNEANAEPKVVINASDFEEADAEEISEQEQPANPFA